MVINQPSNQIRLTNVSLVRMKKGKKRFEIACYKNKVLEWRSGVETDLDNVLQIPAVFISVGKGQMASAQELGNSFGDDIPLNDIIMEILNKGELQVGEKERQAQLDRVHHEVIDIVAGKLVDPRTKRVYTTGMIEKALAELSTQSAQSHQSHNHQHNQQDPRQKSGSNGNVSALSSTGAVSGLAQQIGGLVVSENGNAKGKTKEKDLLPGWTGVVTTRSAKSQALDAMKALITHQPIPVARARMRLRITCPTNLLKQSVKANTNPSINASTPIDVNLTGKAATAKGKSKAKGAPPPPAPPPPPSSSRTGQNTDESEPSREGRDGEERGSHHRTTTTIKDRILSYVEQVEMQDVLGEEWEVVGFVEPGAYKAVGEWIGQETKGRARVEVLDLAVVHEDE